MAATRSVHFSPILEQPTDETSDINSDVSSFSTATSCEEAYATSLSRSAKKYRLPSDDENETRPPSKRKIALLGLGFILLLGVGGVAIYFITREIFNRGRKVYSAKSAAKNVGFPLENTTVKIHITPQVTMGTIRATLGRCCWILALLSIFVLLSTKC